MNGVHARCLKILQKELTFKKRKFFLAIFKHCVLLVFFSTIVKS